MNVVILGLWHLGSVTSACVARHHQVTGLDFDEQIVAGLRGGRAPLHEPDLDALVAAGLASGRLQFSIDPKIAAAADVIWVCFDTPVDADDRSDVPWVMDRIGRVLPLLRPGTVVLISSQMPAGTCATLAKAHPGLHFACSPENLRLGKAIEAFEKPARIVVGAPAAAKPALEQLLAPIGAPLVWMLPASAEMVKHALNSFLALSVAYINEVSALAEMVGADAQEVTAGLKSEPRIGPRAYLAPGGPFAGGTLARDVVSLTKIGEKQAVPLTLIPAIKESNDRHRGWALRKLRAVLPESPAPIVAVLGLAYTPGTNTLRRSAAVELCRQLATGGATVRAFDPLIRTPDAEHQDLTLFPSAADAVRSAHAVVICTEAPEFRNYPWPTLLASMARPIVVDAGGIVEKATAGTPGLLYFAVGKPGAPLPALPPAPVPAPPAPNLSGRTILVTGGSQGLGRHIVEAFLAAGANVVFCARTAPDVERTRADLAPRLSAGQRLGAIACDVGDPASVAGLFAYAAQFGPLHAVVNNAGIYGAIGPSDTLAIPDWNQAWQVNVTGTLMICQHAIQLMKPTGSGKIINISGGGATNPMPRFAAYAATKAAVVRLTETLAEEYRADRIDINAVAPGALHTRLTQQVLAAGPEKAGADFFARNKKWADEGAADPKVAAALCVFLASELSNGITGKLISAQWDPWKEPAKLRAAATGDVYTLRRIVPEDRPKKS